VRSLPISALVAVGAGEQRGSKGATASPLAHLSLWSDQWCRRKCCPVALPPWSSHILITWKTCVHVFLTAKCNYATKSLYKYLLKRHTNIDAIQWLLCPNRTNTNYRIVSFVWALRKIWSILINMYSTILQCMYCVPQKRCTAVSYTEDVKHMPKTGQISRNIRGPSSTHLLLPNTNCGKHITSS